MSAFLIKDYDQQFSFAQKSKDNNTSLNIACFDNALFYKGFLLSAVSQMRHLALSDETSARLYELLTSCHRNLAQQYALPVAERNSANITNLEAKANTLEKELTAKVAGFGKAQRQVNWKEVQSQLQPSDAAVEFVHYIYCTPDLTDSVVYSALVLRPGNTSPHFIPLFEGIPSTASSKPKAPEGPNMSPTSTPLLSGEAQATQHASKIPV